MGAAIISASAQLGEDGDVVVVDDGSPEPLDISDIVEADRRVRLVRMDRNMGPAAARNFGVANARNDLIAFLDSDDVWLPGKLEAQVSLLTSFPSSDLVAVSCGWRDVRDGTAIGTRIPAASRTRSDFFSGCWHSPGSTLLLHRRAFSLCGPFVPELRRLEDFEWFLRFALAGGTLAVADVVGADIAKGRRALPGPVHAAADIIWSRYRALNSSQANHGELRRLRAWLDVERAVAARNAGRPVRMAVHLARSFFAVPRRSVQLANWWRS